MRLHELSVKKPVLVMIGLVTLLAMGGIASFKLPIEFLPHVEFPFIGVFIPYPNSHPDYIERHIVKPVEEVFATLGNVHRIQSQTQPDGAFVGVEFEWGRDVNVLRMEVKEKLDQIRPDLPADVEHLQVFTFDTNDIPIVEGRISAVGRDLSGSYDLIERSIINPLKRVDGVGNVFIEGVEPKEIAIYLSLDKIKSHRVDVGNVFRLLQSANATASGGKLTANGIRYTIRSLGSFQSIDDIENLVVSPEGLRLKDIADVYYGEPVLTYGRRLNGEHAVAFWIQKASNANTVDVARRVHKAMDKMNSDPALKGINVLLFFDQSAEILNGVHGLRDAGVIGGFLAVAILYFFLRRMTTTLIIAVSIPFSLICTLAFLYFSGHSLNMLTMMGLMLGVGMLVDNAIVVLESIYRHQNRGENSAHAAITGTSEVATAVTASTLTTVIVFAPIVFGGKDELFVWLASVGVTISVAILFSLLVSLTLIPFLASKLKKPKKSETSNGPLFFTRLEERYARTLEWTTFKHPRWTLGIVTATLLITVAGAKIIGLKGPQDDDSLLVERIYMDYKFSDNVGYKEADAYVKRVEAALEAKRDSLEIETIYSYYRDNSAATTVYFKDKSLSKEKLKEKRKELRRAIPDIPGVTLQMGNDSGESSGGAQLLQVNLFGDDKMVLADVANEVKRRLGYVKDLTDVKTSVELGGDEINISLDSELVARYNLTAKDIASIMGLTFRGVQLDRFRGEDREVPMSISLDPSDQVGIYNLNNLLVGMTDDKEITLGSLAKFTETKGPTQIERDNQRTIVSVQGLYEGKDFGAMLKDITGIMNTVTLPPGYIWSFSREIKEKNQQQQQMLINSLLAILCVYLIMAALFESYLHPLVIMICLPLAAVGVIWMLLLTHTSMGLMAMIGVVILIGVVVNNGIVLIDHVNFLRKEGMSIEDAVMAGGRERLRPILMTATTTVLGLLPMALGSSHIGDAQYYPLARAVMGGLVSSTFLTLLVLPAYYVLGERAKVWWANVWARSRPRLAVTGEREATDT
jgi:hydrophobic/amphiphilic exporter-1 (mainly G- bacteria), HAE1 family